jgi:hypothetical protein
MYINIFHCKTLQNLPKLEFFGLKMCLLATLVSYSCYAENKTKAQSYDSSLHTTNPNQARFCSFSFQESFLQSEIMDANNLSVAAGG